MYYYNTANFLPCLSLQASGVQVHNVEYVTMAERSNAISELTRFWLQAKHRCLVYESLPVPVPYNQSDIDLLAIRGDMQKIELPNGVSVGPRLIVETKDEHDWEPTGREFGKLLDSDIAKMVGNPFIPKKTACKFSMLREEHYGAACDFFSSDDFDRLFVLHAIDSEVLTRHSKLLSSCRIHILTIPELVTDVCQWYASHPRRSGLRHTMMGDIWHLLVGFCGCLPPDGRSVR